MGKIILYYKYVSIEFPKRILKWQEKLCAELNLKGRIILAQEGINGTLGGSDEAIQQYKLALQAHADFADIDFKESPGDQSCFPRLSIKVKNEIVNLGIDPELICAKNSGTHLSPEQANELLLKNPNDLVILDARNHYESHVGAFKDALKPDIKTFRQLPVYIDQHLEQFKDKQVLMYCTGGVRCERASAYLKSKNVATHVYQLEGGIHRYIEQYPEGFFEGKNYVFDNRLLVKANNTIVGSCSTCKSASDEYSNCLNAACNKHFICCSACQQTLKNTCSQICFDLIYKYNAPQRPPFVAAKVFQ
jgi:UPF0176 protein